MDDRFSLFPLEKVAWELGGLFANSVDAQNLKLPFEIVKGVSVENVASHIRKDEFEYCERELGSYTTKYLQETRYAIVHRFKNVEIDGKTGGIVLESELQERSRKLIQQIVACLRLIRPTSQHAQFMGGNVELDGAFRHFHFDNPFGYVSSVPNQRLFFIRSSDIEKLRFYAPRFIEAVEGDHSKYIMAVDMYQSGFFQHSYWKVRFFLWTAALEALFTSHTSEEHRGSLVAKERIKWVLGEDTLVYPPDELTEFDTDPKLRVRDVIDEIYCLRNHIAHGDRVPQYYFETVGRKAIDESPIYMGEMLSEAISSIVRQSLLVILERGLISHFKDAPAAENYFKGHTKSILKKKVKSKNYPCPK